MNIKDFAEKFIKAEDEAWLKGDTKLLEELEDPNVVYHSLAMGQELAGFEMHKQQILAIRQAAPGFRENWTYLTGDGNVFAALSKTSGAKFTGTVPGFPPPTGKEIVSSTLFVFRLNKGKIVEAWSNGVTTGLT